MSESAVKAFAAALVLGGGIGYARVSLLHLSWQGLCYHMSVDIQRGSVISLAAGASCGSVFFWAAQDIQRRKHYLKLANAVLIMAMVKRFAESKKFMPAGVVAAAAIVLHFSL